MTSALSAITRAMSALGMGREHPLIEALCQLASGGSAPQQIFTVQPITDPSPAVVTASSTTHLIHVVPEGAFTVLCPPTPTINQGFTVKGNPSSPVTLLGNGHTIDGESNYTMPIGPIGPSSNVQQGVTVVYDGTEWKIVWSYPGLPIPA